MGEQAVLMDLSPSDVHTPGAGGGSSEKEPTTSSEVVANYEAGKGTRTMDAEPMQMISQDKRDSLEGGQFALPSKRKYPLDTAARTRNASARLEQMKKRGKLSDTEYAQAKGHIAKAAKKFGIESQYNEKDNAFAGASKPRRGSPAKSLHIRADLAPGGSLHVRHHMGDDGVVSLYLPPLLIPVEP